MTSFEVIPTCDREGRTFDTRAEAEEGKQTHVELCPSCHEDDVMIDDGVDDMDDEVDVVEHTDAEAEAEAVSDGGTQTESETAVVPRPRKPRVPARTRGCSPTPGRWKIRSRHSPAG